MSSAAVTRTRDLEKLGIRRTCSLGVGGIGSWGTPKLDERWQGVQVRTLAERLDERGDTETVDPNLTSLSITQHYCRFVTIRIVTPGY